MSGNSDEEFVEALEEGRIVRVPEIYARLEGLTILRKSQALELGDYYKKQTKLNLPEKKTELKPRKGINLEPYRKPLKYKENDIASSLVDNFHWVLLEKRRARDLTRKQLAQAINEKEDSIKSIENGVVQDNNYILINKLERYFKITLRKDEKDFSNSMAEVMRKANERESATGKKSFIKQDDDDLPELKDLLGDSENIK